MGVKLHVIALPSRAYWRERRAFRELCLRLRPDIVHTHGHHPDIVLSGVARRLGIATVSTMHGFFHQNDWRGRLTARLQVSAFSRMDTVVAVSAALADDLRSQGVPAPLVTAIPNAFHDLGPPLTRAASRSALGVPDDAFVVGWVGRISPQKALETAIAALRLLEDLPIRLSVVGDGDERLAMEEFARTQGVGDRIKWHGALPNAPELMRAFDVFVLSSRWEGTPIVLFEAMSAGVPVVASTVGGVPDVVSQHEAILVPPGDARAIADGVRQVYADRHSAAERARAAEHRLRVEFDPPAWVDRYDALYRRLLKRR
jgi:glycosyltransferase involved in cell wall biosynthesis